MNFSHYFTQISIAYNKSFADRFPTVNNRFVSILCDSFIAVHSFAVYDTLLCEIFASISPFHQCLFGRILLWEISLRAREYCIYYIQYPIQSIKPHFGRVFWWILCAFHCWIYCWTRWTRCRTRLSVSLALRPELISALHSGLNLK